jgi:hypothetical protein
MRTDDPVLIRGNGIPTAHISSSIQKTNREMRAAYQHILQDSKVKPSRSRPYVFLTTLRVSFLKISGTSLVQVLRLRERGGQEKICLEAAWYSKLVKLNSWLNFSSPSAFNGTASPEKLVNCFEPQVALEIAQGWQGERQNEPEVCGITLANTGEFRYLGHLSGATRTVHETAAAAISLAPTWRLKSSGDVSARIFAVMAPAHRTTLLARNSRPF